MKVQNKYSSSSIFKLSFPMLLTLQEIYTLNAGAHVILEVLTRIEPFEPILTMTHFVRTPFLSSSWPARTGFVMPVNDSAWHIICRVRMSRSTERTVVHIIINETQKGSSTKKWMHKSSLKNRCMCLELKKGSYKPPNCSILSEIDKKCWVKQKIRQILLRCKSS